MIIWNYCSVQVTFLKQVDESMSSFNRSPIVTQILEQPATVQMLV